MILLKNIMTVFRFEWAQAVRPTKIAWWSALALFPPLVVSLIILSSRGGPAIPRMLWPGLIAPLVVGVVSTMGVFLWSAPAIHTELESKHWTYLSVRPYGTASILLGKYMVAVAWTVPAAVVGLTLSILISQPRDAFLLWRILVFLSLLSCMAFGAVYSLIGVIIPKRGMVAAVVYTLGIEIMVSFIPAVINQATVQFRLRSSFLKWHDDYREFVYSGPDNTTARQLFGDAPAWVHISVLCCMIIGLLCTSLLWLRYRELVVSEDD